MRLAARAGAALAATAFVALAAPPAPAAPGVLTLPRPPEPIPVPADAFKDRPERLRQSIVPGRVDDTERIEVGLGPDGSPAVVTATQRLVLHGTGQFVVWQRASAQDAEPLEDTPPPVVKREALIWQGFVDGRKTLAARITLDPGVERDLLPLAVTLEWRGAGAIGPGGALPGAGDVVVRISNTTSRAMDLPTGEVDPPLLVSPLDTLLRAGEAREPATPPAAARGIPASLPARDVGPTRGVNVTAPLRVTGTIRVSPNGTVASELPGAVPVPDGLELDGVLHGDVEYVLRATEASTLAIDLRAFPTVDPRTVTPPNAPTWAAWAARGPSARAAREATETLVMGAAQAARAHEYAPYLGLHGRGTVVTSFHVSMAPADVVLGAAKPLRPRALPIALAGVALLGVVANGAAIWLRL